MALDKFEELYPDYELIPEKRSKLGKWAIQGLVAAGMISAVVVPLYILQRLGEIDLPIASSAGVNELSVMTARNLAEQQMEAGQFTAAASNFKKYFDWGGKDPETMRLYSRVLVKLGYPAEAKSWTKRASARVKALEDN